MRTDQRRAENIAPLASLIRANAQPDKWVNVQIDRLHSALNEIRLAPEAATCRIPEESLPPLLVRLCPRPPHEQVEIPFVTDGIEAAVAKAKELAGDKNVAVNGGQMARQCLEAVLLDEVGVELVPVVLGGGTPLFPELGATPVQFEGPVAVVEGTSVTHLRYRIKR
jgi:hypothetical protein